MARDAGSRSPWGGKTGLLPAELERVLGDVTLGVSAAVGKVALALWLPALAAAVGRDVGALDGEGRRALLRVGGRRGCVVCGSRVKWRGEAARRRGAREGGGGNGEGQRLDMRAGLEQVLTSKRVLPSWTGSVVGEGGGFGSTLSSRSLVARGNLKASRLGQTFSRSSRSTAASTTWIDSARATGCTTQASLGPRRAAAVRKFPALDLSRASWLAALRSP